MTERRAPDAERPIEDDPTGMRALLSSLPDPGPMPADLTARITARLAAERTRQLAGPPQTSGSSGLGDASWGPSDTITGLESVVDLRSRRRRLAWALPAAAAGVVGLAGGGALLAQQVIAPSLSASGPATVRAVAASPTPFAFSASHRRYTRTGLADQVRAQWADTSWGTGSFAAASPRQAAQAAVAPSLGALTTLAGAQRCLQQVGRPATGAVLVDEGTLDGRPVTLVVTGTAHSGWLASPMHRDACVPVGDAVVVPAD